ncbi:hypothetical protein JL720_8925 [Aureococcus anophagefferens]|nr:hypothetical protein JL720_8925 [Aureococcus anophagefferens]
MALRKNAGDVARGARSNNYAALAKKKDDDAAPPPPLPRSPEQSSSRKGLQGTPPRRRPGDAAATPSPARRSAPSSATSSSAASRSEPLQQSDTGRRARMLSHLGPPQPIDLSLNAARLPRSAGSSHSDGDGSHGPESDGEARRWWKRRDHKSSSVSSSARDLESSEDGDSDREPLGWSKDAGGAIANHLATFRFQRALDAAVAGAESDHGTTGSAERRRSRRSSASRARRGRRPRSSARRRRARPPPSRRGPRRATRGTTRKPTAARRRLRRDRVKPAHLGAIAPAPAIELYPKTRSVLKLHAAIALGDARAVRAAAEDGAAGGHVGAFATMARALHVAAARDGAFGRRARAWSSSWRPTTRRSGPRGSGATRGSRRSKSRSRGAAARELFASMLCRARSFDVDFGGGPLGIKLALVRHVVSGPASRPARRRSATRSRPGFPPPPPPPPPPLVSRRSRHSPEAASKGLAAAAFRGHRRANSDGSSAPPLDPHAAAKQSRRQRALEAERAASKSHRRVRSHDNAADAETADDFCASRTTRVDLLLRFSPDPSDEHTDDRRANDYAWYFLCMRAFMSAYVFTWRIRRAGDGVVVADVAAGAPARGGDGGGEARARGDLEGQRDVSAAAGS